MTRKQKDDPRDGSLVPPPLDTHIPTDDELDALCDEMMRFETVDELAARAAVPKIAAGA